MTLEWQPQFSLPQHALTQSLWGFTIHAMGNTDGTCKLQMATWERRKMHQVFPKMQHEPYCQLTTLAPEQEWPHILSKGLE